MAPDTDVTAVRSFNRFYTRQIGLLNEGLLKSEFSLTEARVLYELANGDRLTATALSRALGLDAGYLSRLLKKFETRGFIARSTSGDDARQAEIVLTDEGRAAFDPLEEASSNDVSKLLAPLAPDARDRLVNAMMSVQRILDDRPTLEEPYILRDPYPGDIGWITHRHGVLYNQEYGFDATFEALVAEIAGQFVKTHDPRWERCWIAERDGDVVGSVFMVRQSESVAKLRLLYVEPSARGLGIGRRLVEEVVRFARQKGYATLTLWTNDILTAAMHIYESTGFVLTDEEPHHSFGQDLVGQTWVLDLGSVQ